MKIDLPRVESKHDAKAHPFPMQIAYQTQEFMQGSIFYNIFSDTAAGQRVRQPNALDEIEEKLLEDGMKKDLYEESWGYLERYNVDFPRTDGQFFTYRQLTQIAQG